MAIKLEWILVVMISAILIFAYGFKLEQHDIYISKNSKDLEFYSTSFTKVDEQSIISVIDTKYGILQNSTLNVYHIVYHDKEIDKLRADKAILIEGLLYMEGNVSVYQKDGFQCFSQNALYEQSKSIISIPNEFLIKMKNDIFKGTNLIYNLNSKLLKASNVDALLEL